MHGDLSPNNILVDSNNRIKIGDFGISFQLNSIFNTGENLGFKEFYAAPEVLTG